MYEVVRGQYSTQAFVKDSQESVVIYEYKVLKSQQYKRIIWSMQSLDVTLGLVGGIVSIVWLMLETSISPYESFKFKQSLIKSVYPTAPKLDELDQDDDASRGKANKQLEQTISNRGLFRYTYWDYNFTWFLKTFCCCCIN